MKIRRASLPLSLAAMVLAMQACATLEAIPDHQCGNRLIETAEDCDSFPYAGMQCHPPGSANQCRFQCDPKTRVPACAGSYTCGEDGICRRPSGHFVPAGSIDEGAAALTVRDFDADGSPDLLIRTSDSLVLAFTREPFSAPDRTVVTQSGPPADGDLSAEGRVDLAFATPKGVSVLRATESRSFAGTAYPTFTIPFGEEVVMAMLDGNPKNAGKEAVVAVQSSAPDATSILFVSEVKQPPVVSVIAVPGSLPVLGGAMQPLLGEIATGRLDDDPADLDPLKLRTPCDEFVLAFRAANQVFVATPCQNDGSANAYTGSAPLPVPMIKVDLSGCANLAVDRAFVVDAAPADGRLDVLITPMNGGRPCVVHGPFTFGKDSTPAAPALGAFSNEWMLEADERALMVDDVNGDGALDLVTTKGIFVSGACDPALGSSAHVGLCDATPFAFALPIAFARHGDLNGDHIEDVVIANGVSDRVWVELGAGDGTFASFLVETQNEFTGDMVVADFDGDGVDDLVYTDRLCAEITPDCQGSDTLSIAFGRTTMGPEPVVNFGRIGRIRQLVSARLRAQDGGFDGITDLGVLFTDLASPQETKVANLYGVSDRALQAPFAIVTQQGTSSVESTPVQLAQGVFVPRDGPPHGDLAIVTGHSETSEAPALWLLQAEGGAELSMARTCRTPIEGVSDTWLAGAFVTAHNLDDDPEDEVVLVGGNGFFIGDPRATPGGTCFHLDAITTHEFIDASILRNIEPVPRPVPVVLEDVNGDGFADVITLGVIPSGEEVLAIYWNEKGSFSADRRSAITVATDPKLFASAVIAVNLDADVAKELVLVGPSFGIQRLDVNNALELTPAVLLFAPSDLPFAAPRTVNTGDFNHDGVPDLVFGSELMLSLYLGAPENVGVVK